MTDPNTPQSPEDRPQAPTGDEEAARLLEVGLSDSGTSRKTPPPSPQEMGEHFPDLEILEVLGQGGMGVVYKARQRKLDRLVALKVLPRDLGGDPAFAERFAREARTLARLRHAHIVGVYEFGESDGLYFLLMEFVDGVTLRELMSTGELNAREALAIVPQICDALQYAHDEGVVHRDIKPENVLLDRAGQVKVADFGLAKMAQRGPADFTLTGTDQVMGTWQYMAPEQYKTPQDVDHRADIFSLGVVFYEMLTGELPVGRFANPSEAPDLDARIDEIVMRALERERDMRYQNAGDLTTDIEHMASGSKPFDPEKPATAGMAQQRLRKLRHRRWWHDRKERPLSRWASWSFWLLPAGAFLAWMVYLLVYDTSDHARGYHATKAGLFTAIGIGTLATLCAFLGIRATKGRDRPVHGLRLSVVCLCLAAFGTVTCIAAYFQEKNQHARMLRWQAERRLPKRSLVDHPRVQGTDDTVLEHEVRKGVREAWGRLRLVAAVRDLTLDHAESADIYDPADLRALRVLANSDAKEYERRLAANELGMGFVRAASLSSALRMYRIESIQLDRSQRQATVTAYGTAVYEGARFRIPRLAFFMKRADTGWVFVVDKVRIEDGR